MSGVQISSDGTLPPSGCAAVMVRGRLTRADTPVESAHIAPEILDSIVQVLRNRRGTGASLTSELRQVAGEHGILPPAIVYLPAGSRDWSVPDPFDVPFEPTVLNEGNELFRSDAPDVRPPEAVVEKPINRERLLETVARLIGGP